MLKLVNLIMQHVKRSRSNSNPSASKYRNKEKRLLNDDHLIDIADGVNKYLLFTVSKFWCSANC